MSTGANCAHYTDGLRWAYTIQKWPYGEWPEYDYHGPFPSKESAIAHLDAHYANPGGWSVIKTTPENLDRILSKVTVRPEPFPRPPRRWSRRT
jgi:hypothetical protein